MADSPQRRQQSYQRSRASPSTVSDMAMLTATPTAHTGFRKEYPWDAARTPPLSSLPSLSSFSSAPTAPTLPQQAAHESSRIVLPPIRSAIPALLEKPLESASRSAETSPATASYGGPLTSPTYVHSPALSHKRKREGGGREEEDLDRTRQIPRLHAGFESSILQHPPPSSPRHRGAEGWHAPMHAPRLSPLSRGSTHERQDIRALPPPPPQQQQQQQQQPPPQSMAGHSAAALSPRERSHASSSSASSVRPQTRDHYGDEYHRDYPPAAAAAPAPPAPPHRYPPSSAYEYPPHRHHSHLPPLSTASTTPTSPTYRVSNYERTPFSSATPYSYYHDSRYGGVNGISLSSDGKGPRKRRGNLPKETTDKLRSWFMSHLTHPYPTEDEKQELMRQTGLQMNQISNWFINARRRQLPAMINNARVETDATSGRVSEGGVLPTTERHELHHGRSLTLSDGEGPGHGLYDDDGDSLSEKRSAIKRGSV